MPGTYLNFLKNMTQTLLSDIDNALKAGADEKTLVNLLKKSKTAIKELERDRNTLLADIESLKQRITETRVIYSNRIP